MPPNPVSLLALACVETAGRHHTGGNEDGKEAEASQRLPMRRATQFFWDVASAMLLM